MTYPLLSVSTLPVPTGLRATFDTDTEGFSVGTRIAAEGQNFNEGYLSIAAGATSSVSFTGLTTGDAIMLEFYVRSPDGGTGDSFIYGLPTAGSILASNSIFTFKVTRSAGGDSWNAQHLTGGGGGSYTTLALMPSTGWCKFGFLINWSAKTYNVYVGEKLWIRNIAWRNTSAADLGRFGTINSSGTTALQLDNVFLYPVWAIPQEATLIEDDFTARAGNVEDTKPDTDIANIAPQKWSIPDPGATGWNGFTRTANGLEVDGTGTQACSALVSAGSGDGIWTQTFTAATSGGIYGGLIYRSWGGDDGSASHCLVVYDSTLANPLFLAIDDAVRAQGTLTGTSISAGADWTLKVIARGRLHWVYVNDVLQLSGPYQQTSTDQRGIMQEYHAGPRITLKTGTSATNYVKSFKFTGNLPQRTTKTIGEWRARVDAAKIKEISNSGLADPNQNLVWSGGLIQFAHISEHDVSPYAIVARKLYDTTNVLVEQRRNLCLSEGEAAGWGEFWLTFRRNGFWVSDEVFIGNKSTYSYGPDVDLRQELFSRTYRYATSTGSSTSVAKTLSPTFTLRTTSVPPVAHQAVSSLASGDNVRITHGLRGYLNTAAKTYNISDKLAGYGDPFSLSFVIPNSGLSTGDFLGAASFIYLERGSGIALSDAVVTGIRDDIKTPLVPTITVGSLNTGVTGDRDADGFNERHGWVEINCSGGYATFTIPGATVNRYYPCVRLRNYTAGGTITGLTAGVDYVLDDLGDGHALLQILSVVTSSTEYAYVA